jgi:predicted RNase H-like nuclease (RuvC/YqgF family)
MFITIRAEDFQGKAEIKVLPGKTINDFMSSLQFYTGEEKMRFIIENWNKISLEDLELCMNKAAKYREEIDTLNDEKDEMQDRINNLEDEIDELNQ